MLIFLLGSQMSYSKVEGSLYGTWRSTRAGPLVKTAYGRPSSTIIFSALLGPGFEDKAFSGDYQKTHRHQAQITFGHLGSCTGLVEHHPAYMGFHDEFLVSFDIALLEN